MVSFVSTPNGCLDPTFGDGGMISTKNPVTGLMVQADGEIVAVEAVGTNGISLPGTWRIRSANGRVGIHHPDKR